MDHQRHRLGKEEAATDGKERAQTQDALDRVGNSQPVPDAVFPLRHCVCAKDIAALVTPS